MTDDSSKYPAAKPERPAARLWIAVLIACLLLGGVATAATNGVFSVGDEIPAGDDTELPPQSRLRTDETVIATGSAPVAGRWRMTAHKSESSEGQPGGLPCIRLVFTDPPAETPLTGSGFCGEVGDDFGAVSIPAVNKAGDSALLIFGVAPTGAARVEMGGPDDDKPIAAEVETGGPSFDRADVFVMSVPPGVSEGPLTAVKADGAPASDKKIRTDGFFDRLQQFQRIYN
jgi:hypothetical protein